MKKKLFWGNIEEELINKYIYSNDNNEKERILLKLIKKIKILINNIFFTYFASGKNLINSKIIKEECLSHVILNLIKYDPAKENKSYSYIGTIAKHYFINIYVRNVSKNTFFLEEKYIPENFGYENTKNNENNEELIYKTTEYLIKIKNLFKKKEELKKYKTYILMIDDTIRYINENKNFSLEGLIFILNNKYDIKYGYGKHIVFNYFNSINMSKEYITKLRQINGQCDNRIKDKNPLKEIYEYDDYTPIDNIPYKRSVLKNSFLKKVIMS